MTRSARWGAPWFLALALVAACSATDTGSAPKVASIPTSSSGSPTLSSAPPSGESQRPQLRLDSSDEEENRYWGAYGDCKAAHGAPIVMGGDQGKSPNEAAATKACENLLPLQPPELDESKPDYKDKYRVYLKCLNDAGLAIEPVEPFGTGWTYTDRSPADASERSHELGKKCQLEAFRG
ncbi:hypothetical protein [Umezawaea sp. NPDC059074]|uniref:hypothetical protein n=1 Tax=Umezawaea sp. NPDC059074 TaxID=3346716 RepID=UPI0036D0594B